MSEIRLYIALSVDGFIADADGGVGWLSEVAPMTSDEDYGYAAFYDSIGSLVMGRKTYQQVVELGDWPYTGRPVYVFSRRGPEAEDPNVEFVSDDPIHFMRRRGSDTGKDIWLVGGAGLVASFRKDRLIDEYRLFVMPVLLGDGIPLFRGNQPETRLRLSDVQRYDSGVVELRYRHE